MLGKDKLKDFRPHIESKHTAEIAHSRCGLSDRLVSENFIDEMSYAIKFLMVGLRFVVQN
jgi:hypothetical protein